MCPFYQFILVSKSRYFIQIQSFEAELSVPEIAAKEGGPPSFHGVFIRAPAILEVGPEVEVLADVPVASDKRVESQEVHYQLSLLLNSSPSVYTCKFHLPFACLP